MSWLSNAFGSHQRDPAESAMGYLNQIPGQVKPYYEPYQEAGKSSLEDLQKRYQDMLNNPGELYNQLGAGYKQSPGYEATLRTALSGANNAAALGVGGGLGSPGAINNTAQAAGDVANQDFQQYLKNVLGLHSEGLQGEQGLETQGYGANTDYSQMLAQLLGTQGQYAYEGQKGKNANQSQNWSNLFSGLGTLGAGIAGGPIGALAANKFFPSTPQPSTPQQGA